MQYFFVAEYDYTTPMISCLRETLEETHKAILMLQEVNAWQCKRVTIFYFNQYGMAKQVEVFYERKKD